MALAVVIVGYSSYVLYFVSSTYQIGIRSALNPRIQSKPTRLLEKRCTGTPQSGDMVLRIGDEPLIRTWSDMLRSPGRLQTKITSGTTDPSWYFFDDEDERHYVKVECERAEGSERYVLWCELYRYPLEEMVPSLIWLFLKAALFIIGFAVYWKRPDDLSARRFYIVCVVTLGAYIGGYHWSYIAVNPTLLIAFMTFAILLPVVNLHFYLTFPRPNALLERFPGRTLAIIYGIAGANLAVLLGLYLAVRDSDSDAPVRQYLLWAIYGSFGLASVWYLACVASLIHSLRTVQDAMERSQVKCILVGVFFSLFPIAPSLYIVLASPDRFAEGAVTWPMFAASLGVTLAFAVGMTRYRLMELDKIVNSGMGYALVTILAGLLYYGVVFVGAIFYNRFVSSPTLPAALAVSTSALIFVLLLDAARNRIQRVLDRRFSRTKSQLDQTLQQMSQAVSQLVDPPVLAQRLLATVAETLGPTRGAIYLRDEPPTHFRLAAKLEESASAPSVIAADSPLVEALRNGLGFDGSATAEGPLSSAQRQLTELGGEAVQPLMSDGALIAFLVLGPKDTPFRAEDWNLLSAFARITIVALEGVAKHRTIEQLNHELQTKVAKIGEQQRRIVALQSQLRGRSGVAALIPTLVEEESPPRPSSPKMSTSAALAEAPPPTPDAGGIVGSSQVVRQLLTLVRKVAATDAVVLLRGESGTGKELLARAVHETSARSDEPYVKVHCAALSANLLESELFGHVKGAFTGALRDKVGRFELADRGTLFLDEIGDISLDVQTKLLRVLQEKTIERVGSSETLTVNVRIIAATHQNLEELIRQGRFREDLFYRLNVFPIDVPPLRDRIEDLPELALYFVQRSAQRMGKRIRQIDDDVMMLLKSQTWPGNVRQLENAIERAVVLAEHETLTIADLPPEFLRAPTETDDDAEPRFPAEPLSMGNYRAERDRRERDQLAQALAEANGNKSEAARLLGVARSTFVSRMKKLGIPE